MKLRDVICALYDPCLGEGLTVADLLDMDVKFHTARESNLELASTYVCSDDNGKTIYSIDLERSA